MADGSEPLCFTCGLPSGGAERLNHLPNGQVCPACRDRLLETIPAPFPGARQGNLVSPEPAPDVYPDVYDEERELEPIHLRPVAGRRDPGPKPA